MKRLIWIAATAAAIFGLAVLILTFKHTVWPWIEIHTGTVKESGPYYGFWSGFGSDIGEATIIVGIYLAWRHHNCHHPWCWRSGREVEGTPYIACHNHHPLHEETKRAVTADQMKAAYEAAHQRPQAQS